MIDFQGHRFEKTIILTGVRWYLVYPLSYRDFEEMMEERGVPVDHFIPIFTVGFIFTVEFRS